MSIRPVRGPRRPPAYPRSRSFRRAPPLGILLDLTEARDRPRNKLRIQRILAGEFEQAPRQLNDTPEGVDDNENGVERVERDVAHKPNLEARKCRHGSPGPGDGSHGGEADLCVLEGTENREIHSNRDNNAEPKAVRTLRVKTG